jgi:DNA-binding GntR family transcriptional regulator
LGTLDVGGQRRGVGADQPRQLDAEFGQGARRPDVAASTTDQILEELCDRILGGALRPGELLPSETGLLNEFDVQ